MEEKIYDKWIYDYAQVKNRLFLKCHLYEHIQQELHALPYKQYYDMVFTTHVLLNDDGNHIYSCVVNTQLLKKYKVTKQQLFCDAILNAEKRFPFCMHQIEDSEIYSISNTYAFYGGCTILYPETFLKISQYMKGDFIYLPFSVHQIIVMPKSEYIISVLQRFSYEMHATSLSKHVYAYDSKKKAITVLF